MLKIINHEINLVISECLQQKPLITALTTQDSYKAILASLSLSDKSSHVQGL